MNYKFLITILFIGLIGLIGLISPIEVLAASGSVLDFDGTSDYLVASDNAVFDQADRLSISVWIQPDNTPGGDEYIVYRFNDYYLKMDSSRKIIASVHADAETVTSTSAITCDGVEWTHIEMTYDKDAGGTDELKLYIDGVLDGVGDYSTANAVSAELLYIGAADLDGVGADLEPISNFFDGKIDDVRLYQYARSASDVRLDYNDGLAVRLGGQDRVLSDCSLDPASCMDYGLAASYNMDEGSGDILYDQSDNGNDGTLVNDPKWTSGHAVSGGHGRHGVSSGSALSFDGENDYVNCGNDSSLDITDAITIEAWVKPTSGGGCGDYHGILQKGLFDDKYGYFEGHLTDLNELRYSLNNNSTHLISNTTINDDIWSHIVFVYDKDLGSDNLKIFINGVQDANTANYTTAINTGAEVLKIGYYYGSTCYFNGSIDGVKIYNRALSAEEARYHYNRGGPVAHWKFDEGEGTKAFDESGNRNHGTFGDGTCLPGEGACPSWVAGKHSSALSFDGENDYVNCGNDSSLNITDAITIEAWVKPISVTLHHQIVANRYTHNIEGVRMGYIHSVFRGYWQDSVNGLQYVSRDTNPTLDKWSQVVFVLGDEGKAKLYINANVQSDIKDFNGIVRTGSQEYTFIGKYATQYFNGSIDGVKIYNYARTTEQILVDYNNGLAAHLK